jgi:kynureninase
MLNVVILVATQIVLANIKIGGVLGNVLMPLIIRFAFVPIEVEFNTLH